MQGGRGATDAVTDAPGEAPVEPRDTRLFGPGPKAILSLDGGGVRGAVSLAFLERIETLVGEACGRPVRLCEVFDLIGGTSTGAIIASGLALGHTAAEMRDFYIELAPRIFRSSWRVQGWQSKFDARVLQAELTRIIGERTLDSPDLRTGLCVVTKRLDTGSPWILSNNPRSKFWNAPADGAYIGNRSYRLATIVRASAAAPHYFDPELIRIAETGEAGLFVDGAVTPFNNPTMTMMLLATLPQHGLNWRLGADDLTLVSVGTGSFRERMNWASLRRFRAIGLAVAALSASIGDNQTLMVGLMQALGRTRTPWTINSEVGTMAGLPLPGGPLFEALRYDVKLEREWLASELGRHLDDRTVAGLRRLDEPRSVPELYAIAKEAAARQVQVEHLAPLLRGLRSAPAAHSLSRLGEGQG